MEAASNDRTTQPMEEDDEQASRWHPHSTVHQPSMPKRVADLEKLLGDEEGLQGQWIVPCIILFCNLVNDLIGELEVYHRFLEALENAPKPSPFPSDSMEAVR